MDMATAERELIERMARFVKSELKRADMTYEQLADKLREMGHNETKISVANKINRGTFQASFFVAVMRALGREQVNLADV
jgi:ribosome-binding protein aMBF1 (putative translation factor)